MTRSPRAGLLLGLVSALTFGTSGTLVKPLLEAGWSPTAAVTFRILGAAVVLLIPTLLVIRGDLRILWRSRVRIVLYGVVAVVGAQLAYFAAVERIPVGTALLIEYLAPLLLVAWAWARSRHVPQRIVLIGSAVALVGLFLVVGPTGGAAIDPIGVLYAALAAVGCALYYVIGAQPSDGLPPIALAGSSLLVGGLLLAGVAATGLLPFDTVLADTVVFGAELPWFVPIVVLAVVSTAVPYIFGILAASRLGSRMASFLGLTEVLVACAFAWILLGQAMSPLQLLGAALILGGIVCIRLEKPKDPERPVVEPVETAKGTPVPLG